MFPVYAWQVVADGIEYQLISLKTHPWAYIPKKLQNASFMLRQFCPRLSKNTRNRTGYSSYFSRAHDKNWLCLNPIISKYLGYIHVFRIDISKNQFILMNAADLGVKQAFVSELAQSAQAKLAMNGGFFDHTFRPLGLRLHATTYQPIKQVSWWGIFYIKNHHAYIQRSTSFHLTKDIAFAIQGGPRLLVAGEVLRLKPGRDERSALGITRDGKVIMLVTEHAPLTTTELAHFMREDPIDAVNALNLDGGNSSQLYTRLPTLRLDIHHFTMVVDAIVVKHRS